MSEAERRLGAALNWLDWLEEEDTEQGEMYGVMLQRVAEYGCGVELDREAGELVCFNAEGCWLGSLKYDVANDRVMREIPHRNGPQSMGENNTMRGLNKQFAAIVTACKRCGDATTDQQVWQKYWAAKPQVLEDEKRRDIEG